MKKVNVFIISLFILKIVLSQTIPEDSLYLGQKPPGNLPEIFKLEVSAGSFAAERIAISKDGTEIYYSEVKNYYPVRGGKIKYYKYKNNKWNGPFTLFEDFISPALNQSDDTLFFEKNHNSYFSVRIEGNWSKPILCFNTIDSVHYLQITNKGNYFASACSKSSVGLSDWSKILFNGNDAFAVSLGFPINNVNENQDFYIAKDESYIITCPMGPIGISYPIENGKWSNSRFLNKKINFGLSGWGAFVSADNKYLFYTTGTKYDYSDTYIYWVSLGIIIDSLKNTNLPPYIKNKPESQNAIKGEKFIFTIPDNAICDDDGKFIIYEALSIDGKPLPAWLTFDAKAKILSGTPIETGNVVLRINVYDDKNEMAAFRFIIKVSEKK